MRIRNLLCALLAVAFTATVAAALPANTPLTVELSTVSPSGQLTAVMTQAATTDAQGRLSFNFTQVPTTTTARFLMVRILDGATVLRQGMTAAPEDGGAVTMGVSEVTDRQSRAMLQAFAAAGESGPFEAMYALGMVRSGGFSEGDAQMAGSMAATAAQQFTQSLTGAGATTTQMTSFQTGVLAALRDFSAGYQQSVQALTSDSEASIRGQTMAQFLGAMTDAAADSGMSLQSVPVAYDQGLAAAVAAAPGLGMGAGALDAVQAGFRSDGQQRQLRAQIRDYADAMAEMGASQTQDQQFASASAVAAQAMVNAQRSFEQVFASPGDLPAQAQIQTAQGAIETAMGTLFNTFQTQSAASNAEVSTMLGTMASRMQGMGGMMGGMTSQTLSTMGVGMITNPDGTQQNWPIMMASANAFVQPGLGLLYTPDPALGAEVAAPPAPTDFAQFANPYRAMLELQYDLMLLAYVDHQDLEQAQQAGPVTAEVMAQLLAARQTRRAARLQAVGGVSGLQGEALATVLSPPELL